MFKINCRKCLGLVDHSISKCPHCGYDMINTKIRAKPSIIKWISIIFHCIMLIMIIYAVNRVLNQDILSPSAKGIGIASNIAFISVFWLLGSGLLALIKYTVTK